MKRHLIGKLMMIHLAVIAFVMAALWISLDTLAAGYFVTLMEKYNISPEPAHAMFVDSIHRYLLWACLGAAALAALLSFLLMKKILSPLSRMSLATRQIAAGNFQERIPVESVDEVGQLAGAFNRMAESLEKIDRLRRDLMIDVAHELRTPLTNMRGYLEALKDGILPPSPETVDLLYDETLRLVTLVEDVLRLARADAAEGRLEKEPIDPVHLIREAMTAFDPAFKKREMQVDFRISHDIPPIRGDRRRLMRVLRSLLDNAVRYTPQAEQLEIHLEAEKDVIRVEFINSAPDIDTEDLPFLFERFYRGEKSRSREHGGAGIGLAIVKELIEAHGGTVSADMEGKKLRIGLTLPASA